MDQINEWLHTDSEMGEMTNPDRYVDTRSEREAAEVHRMFRERLAEQNSEHNGGKYWIGSGGGSEFGRNGRVAGGIKIATGRNEDSFCSNGRASLQGFS